MPGAGGEVPPAGPLLVTCDPRVVEIATLIALGDDGRCVQKYYVTYACRSHSDGELGLTATIMVVEGSPDINIAVSTHTA
jgi:hypothetical protein